MRAVQLADVEAAALVLLAQPRQTRGRIAEEICADAHCADKYRKRFGRAHPTLGSGTLMSAARKRVTGHRPSANTHDYLSCLALVLEKLHGRQADQGN